MDSHHHHHHHHHDHNDRSDEHQRKIDEIDNLSSSNNGQQQQPRPNYYKNNSFNMDNQKKNRDCCAINFGISKYFWTLARHCYGNIFFWLCSTGLCLFEPILVAIPPVGFNLRLQKMILGISSFLWFLQILGELDHYWKTDIYRYIKHKENEDWYNLSCIQHSLLYLFHRPEYVLDCFCFGCGWATIYFRPGFAALRCYRVYSLLWYYRVDVLRDLVYDFFGPKYQSQVYRIIKVGKFAADALVAFGVDLFFLSSKTKGALMLIGIFFYSSYVLGACLWQETGNQLDACSTFTSCMFTLMRLTFYDGNGFDYLWEVSKVWPLLFFLTVLYLCATAFGVLNGLIGIFASTFTSGSIMELDDGTYFEEILKRPTKKLFEKPLCGHCFQYMCGKMSCVLCPLDEQDEERERILELKKYRALEKGQHFEEITAAASNKSVSSNFGLDYDPTASSKYFYDQNNVSDTSASTKYPFTGKETGFSGRTKDEIEDERQKKVLERESDSDSPKDKPRFGLRENSKESTQRNPFVMQTPDVIKAALDRQSIEIHELKETVALLASQIEEMNRRNNASIIPNVINPFR